MENKEKLVLNDIYQAMKWDALKKLGVFDMDVIKDVIFNNKIAVLEKYFDPMLAPLKTKLTTTEKTVVQATTDLSSVPSWIKERIEEIKANSINDIFAVYNNGDDCIILYFKRICGRGDTGFARGATTIFNFLNACGAYYYMKANIKKEQKEISAEESHGYVEIPNDEYCYTDSVKKIFLDVFAYFNFIFPDFIYVEEWEIYEPFLEEQYKKLQEIRKSNQ